MSMVEKNHDGKPGNFVVLTWRTRLSYGVGHILNDLCANIWFTYLLVYMHEVEELSPVTAGSLLLIGQIADAISTPIVGIESDRTRNCRYGRRKIWHLIGVFCVAFSFPFIFTKCVGCNKTSEYAKIIYYVPFIVIFQFGWATTQISHLALIPELSECKIEKVTLNAIRYGCTVISGIMVFIIMWLLITRMKVEDKIGPDDEDEFMYLALFTVGIGLLFMIIFHVGVREKPRSCNLKKNERSKRNANNWKLWFKDPQFYKIGIIYMCTRIVVNISQVYTPLFTKMTLHQPKQIIAIIPLIVFISGFLTTLVAKPMNIYFGAKITYVIGIVIVLGNCVFCEFLPKESDLVYGFGFLLGVGGSLCLVTCLGILSMLIGENVETGAFVYGAMSFLDKLANGITVQVIQIFHPSSDCDRCKPFYRTILVYVPGTAAVIALLAMATLLHQDIGSGDTEKEPLLSPSTSAVQVKPKYGACQPRRPSWDKQRNSALNI